MHETQLNANRVVDCHIAPYDNTRHIIERRMSVAGAWEENNAPLMLALLAIRASGWWDNFWQWRAERDRRAWRDRQEGMLFRAKRGNDRRKTTAAKRSPQ